MRILIFLLSFSVFAEVPVIEMKNAKAFYIVDGDSISLSMRIKDIDTPEKKQNCRKTEDKIIDCGMIAKQHLQELLNNLPGKLMIDPVGIGHYGRVLVDVYKGEVNIGETMVEEGIAYAFSSRYKPSENIAKKHKRGFWGYYKPPLNPKKWRKRYMKKF
ncbi:MAG: hypothetical protein Ctma_0274 [Catillopecten margaritatus gill symbiont]|uniref:TNase-like domain-containing protein n=1 Tax=Catillopecten margaritatus gill symbiont TaxID=3083288 RepID=A0AAU6PF01_9GAMM